MFDCQSCDEFIRLSKRLQPVSDLQRLRHSYTNCKECDEFCKDSQRLFGKVPFVNCADYKKYSELSKLTIQRQQSKLRKSVLAMVPAMSSQVAQRVLSGIFPKAPTHAPVMPLKKAAPVPIAPAFFMPQAPRHEAVLRRQQPPAHCLLQKSQGQKPKTKPCNPKSQKAKDPKYECNPLTGRWVLKKK